MGLSEKCLVTRGYAEIFEYPMRLCTKGEKGGKVEKNKKQNRKIAGEVRNKFSDL